MAILGRTGLDHPAMSEVPATTVYSKIETIYRTISNDLAGRYYPLGPVSNSTSTVVEHGFGVNLSELRVLIYTGQAPNMTRIADPVAAGWTIAETAGNEKTRLTITTPSSGGPFTFAVWVVHGKGAEKTTDLSDFATTTPLDGQMLIYSTATSKWTPGYPSWKAEAASINSGAIAPTTLAPLQVIAGTPNDLQMIPNPTPGKLYALLNNTGSTINVRHDTGLTNANRIYTGSSGGAKLKDKTAALFLYSLDLQRWIMIGGPSSSSSSSGSGKNYSQNPDDATDWTAVGGTMVVATETNVANIPESNSKANALSLTGTGYATNKSINLDAMDLNRKLSVTMSVAYAGVASEFSVEVYSYASSANRTAGTSATQLSVQTIQRGTQSIFTFDSIGQQFIEVRIVKTASTAMYINSFSVGYPLGQQGSINGPISLTGVWGNSAALTITDSLTYSRVGENLLINGLVTFAGSGGSSSAPLNLSFANLSPVVNQSGSIRVDLNNGNSYGYLAYATGTQIQFYTQNTGTTTTAAAGNTFGAAGSLIKAMYFNNVTIKISEWVNQGTVITLRQNAQSPLRAGLVIPFAGATVPAGWALCDGAEVSQSLYGDLFAQIGTTYNTQINATTAASFAAPAAGNFRLPDYRGLFLRNVGTASGGVASTLGLYQAQSTRKNGMSVTNNAVTSGSMNANASHFHTQSQSNSASGAGQGVYNTATGSGTSYNNGPTQATNTDHQHSVTSNVVLNDGDTETRPYNKGINFIIKLFDESFNLAGIGIASANDSGLTPHAVRCQTKILASNVTMTSGATNLSALSFNNLTVGRWYRLSGILRVSNTVSNSPVHIRFRGTGIYARCGVNVVGATSDVFANVNIVFQATSTTLLAEYTGAGSSSGILYGSGTRDDTFITLEEMPMTETTAWT